MKLPAGVYEQPITTELQAVHAQVEALIARSDVTIESAAQVFALLIRARHRARASGDSLGHGR